MNITQESISNEVVSGRLVAAGTFPLLATRLRVEARGGMARVVCEQRFENWHTEPLHVTYSLPLPADAAVSGFAFTIGERRIVGDIARTADARAQFEEALLSGRSAALLEQDRSSLFAQELGNIPPGASITAEVTLDQPLQWADGEWEWRFPTTVMPRYLGEPGRVPDAMRISQDVATSLSTRFQLSLCVADTLREGTQPSSPSHPLKIALGANGGDIELAAEGGAPLDRDLVVRWAVADGEVGIALSVARGAASTARCEHAYGLLTVVPPEGNAATVPRDLIVLLDTSGSMSGEPLDQARRVVSSLLDSLHEDDTFELLEFSNFARRWREKPVHATEAACTEALAWLAKLRASGSTEMHTAISDALRPVRELAQRQVILVTDGAIGFESEVIAEISAALPSNCRLHTVGIGSAVNRSLTGPAARAGRGIELVLGLGEDVERAVARLLRRTSAPVLVDLSVSGSALLAFAPARLPDLFAGAPLRLGVQLRPEGGSLSVEGVLAGGERWKHTLTVSPVALGSGPPAHLAFFGRESVEDLELELAAGGAARAIDAQIEQAGLAFRIATRKTSWLAMTEEATVDPTAPTRKLRMPHQLPHGTSVDGVGLRGAAPATRSLRRLSLGGAPSMPAPAAASGSAKTRSPHAPPAAPPPAEEVRAYSMDHSFGGALDEEPRVIEMRGASRSLGARRLVVTVSIDRDDFDWTHGDRIELEWASGERRSAIAGASSTRAGVVGSGQVVRLVLDFDQDRPAGEPVWVRVHDAKRTLQIRIS